MANCIVQTGNNAGLNVRAQKTVSSEKLGEIANGASLNVVRCDAVWATFMFNGAPAFVQHKYLLDPPAVNGEGLSVDDGATCNADTVDLCEVAAEKRRDECFIKESTSKSSKSKLWRNGIGIELTLDNGYGATF